MGYELMIEYEMTMVKIKHEMIMTKHEDVVMERDDGLWDDDRPQHMKMEHIMICHI